MPRTRAATVVVIALCAAWAPPSHRLFLLALREAYRVGEITGITPVSPAPGARLAGQVVGFTFHEPPAWYGFAAHAVAAAAAMTPVLLPALLLRRRMGGGRSAWCRGPGPAALRGPAAAILGGIAFAVLMRVLGPTLSEGFFRLGEGLGGSVVRIGTLWASDPGGPFVGGTRIDALANGLVRSGPYTVCQTLGAVAALALHAALWRRDTRAAAAGTICRLCRYDLRGTPPGAPCPECGAARRVAHVADGA